VSGEEQREPTTTVSMSRKINLGNYESCDVFVSLNGVRAGMAEKDLEPLLNTTQIAWGLVRKHLLEQIAAAKANKTTK
jgi:hypothetical protein